MIARRLPTWTFAMLALCGAWFAQARPAPAAESLTDVIQRVQPKIVKIYGVGGFRRLESYQSGFLISDEGHILTAWSYVLDTDDIRVTLDDGRRLQAKLLAADPRLELAVLKVEATDLPYFSLAGAVEAEAGDRVLAFSNLYGIAAGNEPASVLHGFISVRANLSARMGVYETPYNGPVYVLDAMTNNPGSQGGALTDERGQLLGMLGKELRNAQNNIWLNYAIPAGEMTKTVDAMLSGKFVSRPAEELQAKPEHPLELSSLGIVLVPDVLERTPPYVDVIREGSPAAKAGLLPDDVVLFVNDRLVHSCKGLRAEFEYLDRIDPVEITVLRGQELKTVTLSDPRRTD